MKRFAGIVLLLLMGYNLVGYFPAFYAMQQSVKREMRTALHMRRQSSTLTTLSFALKNGKVYDADFEQVEEDEFRYKAEMYDVVRTERTANTITFYCINDKKETRLFAHLQQFVKQNTAENPLQKSGELYNAFYKYEFIAAEKSALQPVKKLTRSIFSPYLIWLSAKHTLTISPPPESLV